MERVFMRGSPLTILVLVLVAMLATAGLSVLLYTNVRQFVIDSPVELPSAPQFTDLIKQTTPTPRPPPSATPAPSDQTPNVGATPIPTTDPAAIPAYTEVTRFTVILLGIDQRPGDSGPFRTDTVIVLSFDPVRKSAAMISIPRDVYLDIPSYGMDTVNVANFLGDRDGYPGGGGPELARKTVERFLGIPIDRYVVVNFQAFNTVINAVGPVEVCPTERIFDDRYPADEGNDMITVEFQPGCQALDAVKLLQYARVRHNAGDDFGRATRQQEVIKAVQKRVLSLGGVSALVGQSGTIWAALKDNIHTNLTYDEILQIANAAQGVTIKSGVLLPKTEKGGQLLPSTLADGRQVLSPVYEDIAALVTQLFDTGQALPTNDKAQAEGAVISVLNGTNIEGLAKRTADALTAKGFVVGNVGNVPADAAASYNTSEIRVFTGKIATARYLAEELGLPGTVIVESTDGPPGIDIMLIVGKDIAPAQ
jgi:polyisoprenyl-teichoic acid--peptidoglycan teichoic acid transferase